MSLVRYRCGDVNLVSKEIHTAFNRYFPNATHICTAKNICIDFIVSASKMLRKIIHAKHRLVFIFKHPHEYSVEYLGMRNMHLKSKLSAHFPDVIMNIIFDMACDDISYTKINSATRLLKNVSWGVLASNTLIHLNKCKHTKFTFNDVCISEMYSSTFVACVFVNCNIKIMRGCKFTRCVFISCTFSREITNVTITKCKLNDCTIKCAELLTCKIIATTCDNIAFVESNIRDTKIIGSNITSIKILSTDMEMSKIFFCAIKQCFIGRQVLLNDVEIKRSTIVDITICSVNIQDCEIRDTDINQCIIIVADISSSLISAHVCNAFINDIKVVNTFVKCHFTNVNTRLLSRDNVAGYVINRRNNDMIVRKCVQRCLS